MNHFRVVRWVMSVAAVSLALAGCGGTLVPAQQGTQNTGSAAQTRARGTVVPALALQRMLSSDHRGSWMSPSARKSTLLYVADEATNDVYAYSYPGGTLEGTLTGFVTPTGLCSNKGGDVFVLNGNGTTVEVFAHGGTSPLRTLNLPGYPELNCSVDPKSGDLAVASLGGSCGDCVSVFANAEGIPTNYTPSGQQGIPGCAYDDKGNLFCDAYGASDDAFSLFEMPRGGNDFATVAVGGTSGLTAGPMMWDGQYLAFGAGAQGTLYQIALSGSAGSVAGSTTLGGAGWVWQFWLTNSYGKKQAKRLIAPTYAGSDGAETAYWKYPAGGNQGKSISGFQQPDGATLSSIKT